MIVQFFSPIKVSLIFANFFIKNKIQINLKKKDIAFSKLSAAFAKINKAFSDRVVTKVTINLITIDKERKRGRGRERERERKREEDKEKRNRLKMEVGFLFFGKTKSYIF